jgi:hypothetical protein
MYYIFYIIIYIYIIFYITHITYIYITDILLDIVVVIDHHHVGVRGAIIFTRFERRL